MQFCFGDIVVIEDGLIGVVVKSWSDKTYEVYVREFNSIKTYTECKIERYMVRHKYLDYEESVIQWETVNGY